MTSGPIMEQFVKKCKVWHLVDFWHVHINTKIDIASDSGHYEIMMHISRMNSLPIRFTNHAGTTIWFHRGTNTSPFAPSFHSTTGDNHELVMRGYDPSLAFYESTLNTSTGVYNVFWNNDRLDDNKHTMLITTNPTVIPAWNRSATNELLGLVVKVTSSPVSTEEAGWKVLLSSFSQNTTVRYYRKRSIDYLRVDPLNKMSGRYERHDGGATHISDAGCFEFGEVFLDGKLQLVRVSQRRAYRWATISDVDPNPFLSQETPSAMNPHRIDGPAIVRVGFVKDVITSSGVTTSHYGDYSHAWYQNNRLISATRLSEITKRHGIKLRSGVLFEEPAVIGDVDIMVMASAFP